MNIKTVVLYQKLATKSMTQLNLARVLWTCSRKAFFHMWIALSFFRSLESVGDVSMKSTFVGTLKQFRSSVPVGSLVTKRFTVGNIETNVSLFG